MNIFPGVVGSGTEYWAAMSAQTTQKLQHTRGARERTCVAAGISPGAFSC